MAGAKWQRPQPTLAARIRAAAVALREAVDADTQRKVEAVRRMAATAKIAGDASRRDP